MTEFRNRVLAFDTIREYDKRDYAVVTTLDELEKQMAKPSFRVRVWDDYKDENFFTDVCELAYLHQDFILVIDEVDQYCGANFSPTGFKKLINYGRHKNIEIICTSRSPAEIPKLLVSQMTDLYIFRMIEPNHLKYICSIYNGSPEDIKKLEDWKFIHFRT